MGRILLRTLIALLLTAFSVTLFHWPDRALILRGWNDFPGLYTAGNLAGTPDLYHKAAFLSRQAAVVGAYDESIQFSRLPYFALVFAPLAHLPYPVAYWLWQLAGVGALVAFSFLWPNGSKVLPILCLLPVTAASFANGQDVPFLLLWIALAFWLSKKQHPFAAGLALSLGMAKPHLFLFLPIALVAKREWKMLAGAATGAASLIAISFLASGPAWPTQLLTVWSDPALHPQITHTSLVAAIGSAIPQNAPRFPLYAALLIAIAAGIWFLSRRLSLDLAISSAIAASALTALHVYIQDYTVCLPLLFLLAPAYFATTPERTYSSPPGPPLPARP